MIPPLLATFVSGPAQALHEEDSEKDLEALASQAEGETSWVQESHGSQDH